jgi:hypothetical protein
MQNSPGPRGQASGSGGEVYVVPGLRGLVNGSCGEVAPCFAPTLRNNPGPLQPSAKTYTVTLPQDLREGLQALLRASSNPVSARQPTLHQILDSERFPSVSYEDPW